ncbi:MAG: hypothetical protein Salg2KO_08530 [Salibacteraceae bacterium]
MRTFAVLLILLLVGSGAGYYYWSHHVSETEEPLNYCPSNADVVIETKSLKDLSAFINDSTSFLLATQPLRSIRNNLSRFLDPVRDRDVPAILTISAIAHDPTFSLIFSKDVEDVIPIRNKVATVSGNWYVVGHFPEEKDNSTSEQTNEVRTAFNGVEDSIAVAMKASSVIELFDSNLSEVLLARLNQEFESIGWLGFGIKNDNPFYTTSIATKANESESRNLSQELVKLAPLKTNAILAIDERSQTWAVLHIPYNNNPERLEDNLFVLIMKDSLEQDSITDQNTRMGSNFANQIWANQSTTQVDLGRAIVISGSEEMAQRFILDFEAYNLLSKSEGLRQLNSFMSDASLTLFIRQISETDQPHIVDNIDPDNTLNALLFQVNSELKNTNYYSFSALFGETRGEQLPIVWSSTFDATITGGPWQFKNHYTEETEFLVQDKTGQLYLVDANGRILWKRGLKDQILGSVNMIDAFNSNKWQLLFVTQNRLHLVDRNGNDVDGFPKRFQSTSKSMAHAIRYKPNGEMRILVADGSTLKNYAADGKPIEGWTNPKFDDGAIIKIDYANYNDKDYLIALTEGKQLHILDRTGKKRAESVILDPVIQSSFIDKGSDLKSCRVISHDSIGNIILKRFDGKQSLKNIIPTGSNIVFIHNDLHDIKYTIVSGDRLFGLDDEFNVAIDLLLPTSSIDKYQWVSKNEGVIAIASNTEDSGYLIDLNKGIIQGIDAKTDEHMLLIDLDNNGRDELLKHDGNGRIMAYRLSI